MNKKTIKLVITCAIIVLLFVFAILIYNNIFADTNSNRFEEIEKHKFTSKEETAIKDSFKELEEIESVKAYANNKIINIVINLKSDVDFNKIKELANNSIALIDEKNLDYYDVEIFVKSNNKESEVYPKIGYKYKGNTEFAW